MMWWYGTGMGGWGYGLMTVGTVLFWALLIFGVIALVRHLGRGVDRSPGARPTPEQVLAERSPAARSTSRNTTGASRCCATGLGRR